jgi:hypothetical protein
MAETPNIVTSETESNPEARTTAGRNITLAGVNSGVPIVKGN